MAKILEIEGALYVPLRDIEDLIDGVRCGSFRKGYQQGRENAMADIAVAAQDTIAKQQQYQASQMTLGYGCTLVGEGVVSQNTNREAYENGVIGGQRAFRDSDHVPFHDPYRGRDSIG